MLDSYNKVHISWDGIKVDCHYNKSGWSWNANNCYIRLDLACEKIICPIMDSWLIQVASTLFTQ